jgi:hypothetical protein
VSKLALPGELKERERKKEIEERREREKKRKKLRKKEILSTERESFRSASWQLRPAISLMAVDYDVAVIVVVASWHRRSVCGGGTCGKQRR